MHAARDLGHLSHLFFIFNVLNRFPISLFANPTSRAECTAEQAYEWSNGKVIFTSGSPFGRIEYEGKIYTPGQGNNAYVFPGIGLGSVGCKAESINDEMLLAAARALSNLATPSDLEKGTLYPALTQIRDVSLEIAIAVAEKAFEFDLATIERPDDLRGNLASLMYDPSYLN